MSDRWRTGLGCVDLIGDAIQLIADLTDLPLWFWLVAVAVACLYLLSHNLGCRLVGHTPALRGLPRSGSAPREVFR